MWVKFDLLYDKCIASVGWGATARQEFPRIEQVALEQLMRRGFEVTA
jgi:hypothetical protein